MKNECPVFKGIMFAIIMITGALGGYKFFINHQSEKPVMKKEITTPVDDGINWGDDEIKTTKEIFDFNYHMEYAKKHGTRKPEWIESSEEIGTLNKYTRYPKENYTRLEFESGHIFYVNGVYVPGFWDYKINYTKNSSIICRSDNEGADFINWTPSSEENVGNGNLLIRCYEVLTE